MPEERISLAKKLLDAIIRTVNPILRYGDVSLSVANAARADIIKTYGCSEKDIIGVFSKDDFFESVGKKEKGKKLVERIGLAICKRMHKIVVTGETIYSYKKGKVNRASEIIEATKQKLIKDPTWRTAFSICLGRIPKMGVFLIDADRSASIHEEGAFHSGDNLCGLAVIIPPTNFNPCKYLTELCAPGNLRYSKCDSKDYAKCCSPKSKCVTKKLKINHTTIEPFIRKEAHAVIFVTDLKKIEKIVVHAIQTFLNGKV